MDFGLIVVGTYEGRSFSKLNFNTRPSKLLNFESTATIKKSAYPFLWHNLGFHEHGFLEGNFVQRVCFVIFKQTT
jgi:hypothetical protein